MLRMEYECIGEVYACKPGFTGVTYADDWYMRMVRAYADAPVYGYVTPMLVFIFLRRSEKSAVPDPIQPRRQRPGNTRWGGVSSCQ